MSDERLHPDVQRAVLRAVIHDLEVLQQIKQYAAEEKELQVFVYDKAKLPEMAAVVLDEAMMAVATRQGNSQNAHENVQD